MKLKMWETNKQNKKTRKEKKDLTGHRKREVQSMMTANILHLVKDCTGCLKAMLYFPCSELNVTQKQNTVYTWQF